MQIKYNAFAEKKVRAVKATYTDISPLFVFHVFHASFRPMYVSCMFFFSAKEVYKKVTAHEQHINIARPIHGLKG